PVVDLAGRGFEGGADLFRASELAALTIEHVEGRAKVAQALAGEPRPAFGLTQDVEKLRVNGRANAGLLHLQQRLPIELDGLLQLAAPRRQLAQASQRLGERRAAGDLVLQEGPRTPEAVFRRREVLAAREVHGRDLQEGLRHVEAPRRLLLLNRESTPQGIASRAVISPAARQ